jgi:DNA helicase II / ATP-dependent DNA helicase PcrA
VITLDEFLDLIRDTPGVERDLRCPENLAQLEAVSHSGDGMLMLAAGPGSGKTTVLILRALRFVLVDDLLPEQLLLTTFTRKAARELRTRWLDWGSALLHALHGRFDERSIDLNRCRIDTIDSIAQEALAEHRLPGALAPVIAETSACKLILKRAAFGEAYRNPTIRASLEPLFARYTFDGTAPANQGDALDVAKRLSERIIQDRVNVQGYRAAHPSHEHFCQILDLYRSRMGESNIFDFASLQELFFARLNDGSLADWSSGIRLLMVDEYQDTNPLQEAIYFSIISSAKPVVTIVGDDDQAMYRFRGGSVELFTGFASRALAWTRRDTVRIDMVRNFRSRPEIVEFYNAHIGSDPQFAPARIAPAKPDVVARRQSGGIPVLGMFRANAAALSNDLSEFLRQLVDNRRISGIGADNSEITLSQDGNLGDVILLSHSVEEARYNRPRGNNPASIDQRFPGLLRHALNQRGKHLFNPRGLALRVIPNVQLLLGLLLLCVDPDHSGTDDVFPTNEARHFLMLWRQAASAFIQANPQPNDNVGLPGFVAQWQDAAQGSVQNEFPRDWPVLELLFKLISWIPEFQEDPEHQVWLEAITRIVGSVGMASAYGMQLLQNTAGLNQGQHVRLSRQSVIRDAILPIAENEVEVDEDILPSVPRDRLQVMTIHQAKGLEFPLVIVDVGSHFNSNHSAHRFRRHPTGESNVVRMEDDVEPYLATPLRGARTPLDRTFDDLVRLYYVAFSRPQSVLLLVGCENCLAYGSGPNLQQRAIPNIALGWNRNSTWPWRQAFQGRPPTRVNPPFELI